jgi:hypothetical protein
MPKGYGQISLYETYDELKDEMVFGDINKVFQVDRNYSSQAHVWEGNNGIKQDTLKQFQEDLKKVEKQLCVETT